MNALTSTPGPGPQQGAALIVGLVMLLILTLLGVSNMNMSTMELRVASNTQNQNHCFQTAESVIESVVAAAPQSTYAIDFTVTDPTLIQAFAPFNDPVYPAVANASARFVRQTTSIGCSGNSLENFSCLHFQITANGQHAASNASCNHVQGVYRLSP